MTNLKENLFIFRTILFLTPTHIISTCLLNIFPIYIYICDEPRKPTYDLLKLFKTFNCFLLGKITLSENDFIILEYTHVTSCH